MKIYSFLLSSNHLQCPAVEINNLVLCDYEGIKKYCNMKIVNLYMQQHIELM